MHSPAAITILRPHQWIKNVLVFAPLIFAKRMEHPESWFAAMTCFAAFSLVASALYIFNDLFDRSRDRKHPQKKLRPLASGKITPSQAGLEGMILLVAGLWVAESTKDPHPLLLMVLAGYVALQLAYNLLLKHHMILDVICIATGFVLRAIGGAVVIGVIVSPWLIICTFALCLFMGFCKRFCEIHSLTGSDAGAHRKTLDGYTQSFLVHLITLSAGLAIVTFLLYATNPVTIERFGSNQFVYTLPLIIYCICRMAMLSMAGGYTGPTAIILRDKPLILGILMWVASAVTIILLAGKTA
jgi:4-hydroxybenzoate polyprenyltransferase